MASAQAIRRRAKEVLGIERLRPGQLLDAVGYRVLDLELVEEKGLLR